MDRDQAIKLMQDLLRRVVEKKASDLFITAGFPPAIKVDGEIRPQSERALTPEQSLLIIMPPTRASGLRDSDRGQRPSGSRGTGLTISQFLTRAGSRGQDHAPRGMILPPGPGSRQELADRKASSPRS